jgi:hypothetical protein
LSRKPFDAIKRFWTFSFDAVKRFGKRWHSGQSRIPMLRSHDVSLRNDDAVLRNHDAMLRNHDGPVGKRRSDEAEKRRS